MRLALPVTTAVFVTLLSPSASAHVNWFVERGATTLPNYSMTDPVFLVWSAVVICMVMISVWLDGRLPTPRIVQSKLRHDFIEILRVFTGMSFLLTAYEGALVAPHKVADDAFGLVLVAMQAIIGIMLIANRWIRTAAILMLVLHCGVAAKFGIFPALEYAIIIGIAFFLLLNSIEDEARRDLLKPYSVDLLRIWTGISLVALAIGEKLAPSALGQVFVTQYQWNFMQALGFTFFDDRLFVLSAGMVEAVIGIVLILGTTVRLAVLALSIMMAVSNVVFILQGDNEAALVEFVGHMPIIGVALLLLLLGYGQRLRITDAFSSRRPISRSCPAPISGRRYGTSWTRAETCNVCQRMTRMSRSDHIEKASAPRALDRPSRSVPSVDRPWDDVEEHARRLSARRGDRAAHRAYHSLYEDMLN